MLGKSKAFIAGWSDEEPAYDTAVAELVSEIHPSAVTEETQVPFHDPDRPDPNFVLKFRTLMSDPAGCSPQAKDEMHGGF